MRFPLDSWAKILRKIGFSRQPRPITTAQLRKEAQIRLGFEELETRYAMAGNVMAVVAGGNLFLKGDELSNHIVIDQSGLAAGQFQVSSGSDTTTINGQAGPLVVNGVTRKVRVAMKGGNDTVEIQNVTTVRDLLVDGGEGDNSVTVQQTEIGHNLMIRNRRGEDHVTIHDSSVAGKLQIHNGKGGSQTEIRDSQIAGRLRVKSHRGQDHVTLDGAQVGGSSVIRLGGDEDLLSVHDSHFGGKLRADGGCGLNDEFQDLGGNEFLAGSPKLKRFEKPAATTTEDDDGSSVQPALRINDVTVNEAAGTAQFTVTLSRPTSQTVGVSYATVEHTAQAGADFTAVSNGSLTFAAGETQKTLSIAMNDDNVDEPSEHFHVDLTSATGATISDGEGDGTIQDDDDAPTIGFDPANMIVNEGVGSAQITVKLMGNETAQTVTAGVTTSDHTATADVDFTTTATDLTFLPGERSKTVDVPIIDDTLADDAEHFHATLFSVVNATVGESSVEVVISDNDGPGNPGGDNESGPTTLGFDPVNLIVSEGAGFARLTIKLTGQPTTQTVTAGLTTTAHSAVAGQDYTTTTTNLSFAPGERAKTVDVPILEDSVPDDAEHFHAVLFNIAGAVAGQTSMEVVISDNDV